MNTTTLVHDPAILGELPEGTVVRDADGDTGTKFGDGFAVAGWRYPLPAGWFAMPVTVVSPPSETAQLIADLSSGLELHPVLKELRSIAAVLRGRFQRQKDELDELTDGYGGIPIGNLGRWDDLKADHGEESSEALLETLARLEAMAGTGSGP
ncbi:hypothetical protein [Kitasatospora sp. NPDC059800]|uniref:hypothetical protein n=1 Tax=Kitasatospora sp. NPDC059800 TaxID=3346951 RepID=UPI003646421D